MASLAKLKRTLRGNCRQTISGDLLWNQQAFVLIIEITFNASADLERFLELWKPLADYVARNEPDTLAYEAARADTKPNTLVIYER